MKRFAACLCAFLFSVLLVVPASAAIDPPINQYVDDPPTFLYQPLPVFTDPIGSDLSPIVDNGFAYYAYWGSSSKSSWTVWYVINRSDTVPVYAFLHNSGSGRVIFATPIQSDSSLYPTIYLVHRPSSGGLSSFTSFSFSSSASYFFDDQATQLRFLNVNSSWTDRLASELNIYTNVPAFDSIRDGLDALRQYIDDPPAPQTEKSFSIPIGYAAWLKASGTLSMRCNFPSNSALFSGTSGWWGETHQTIGSSSALPDASFQFPVADALQILWGRDSFLSPLGILGTTKHAYSEHAAFSPWTVIYNPVYKSVSIGANANDPDSFNGPITVSGMIGEFRLYPLSSGLSSSGIVGDGSSDDYIDVTIDPESGDPVYTDPSGNVVAPPSAGGNTALPEAASNTSLIQRIVGILSDLVNRIEGIFSVSFQAISNLVGLAGPFVAKLSALYSWLPAPVLSALSSAMILAITIGVLKVFL